MAYIEREALLNTICTDGCNKEFEQTGGCNNCYFTEVILAAPSSDVAPVRHERCEYCKDGKSFSGQRLIFGNDRRWHTIQFCPVCGAKMDGGDNP